MSPRRLGMLTVAVLACSGLGVACRGGAASEPTHGAVSGCSTSVEPLAVPTAFTPMEGRFGVVPDRRLTQHAIPAGYVDRYQLPSTLDGLPAQSVESGLGRPDGRSVVYYYPHSVAGVWMSVFEVRGGLYLAPHIGGVGRVVSDPAREASVAIGPYPGLISHDDPWLTDDLRPYRVTWSNGHRTYQLVGVRRPEELVRIARSMVCARGATPPGTGPAAEQG